MLFMNNKLKGSYLIIIKLEDNKKLKVGKFGKIDFKKGYYVYVGSAMNGLEKRIQRHLQTRKKTHWHIDYFLNQAKIINVFFLKNGESFSNKTFKSVSSFNLSISFSFSAIIK